MPPPHLTLSHVLIRRGAADLRRSCSEQITVMRLDHSFPSPFPLRYKDSASLLGSLLRSLLLGFAGSASTEEASSRVVLLQELVHVGLGLLGAHLAWSIGGGANNRASRGHTSARHVLLGSLALGSGSLVLLDLLVVDREEHKLAQVVLQALHVDVHALLGLVLAAAVNLDADGGGVARLDLSSSELGGSETTAQALLHVVADCRAVHLGTKGLEGAGEHLLGLHEAKAATADLLGGLVQKGLVVTLLRRARIPVLPAVVVGDRVVTFGHRSAMLLTYSGVN